MSLLEWLLLENCWHFCAFGETQLPVVTMSFLGRMRAKTLLQCKSDMFLWKLNSSLIVYFLVKTNYL